MSLRFPVNCERLHLITARKRNAKVMVLHTCVCPQGRGIPACLAAGVQGGGGTPACLAGFQAHTQGRS